MALSTHHRQYRLDSRSITILLTNAGCCNHAWMAIVDISSASAHTARAAAPFSPSCQTLRDTRHWLAASDSAMTAMEAIATRVAGCRESLCARRAVGHQGGGAAAAGHSK